MDNIYKNPELFGLVKLQKINYASRDDKRNYHIRAFWMDEGTNEIFTAKDSGNLEDKKPFQGYAKRNLSKVLPDEESFNIYKAEVRVFCQEDSVDFLELAMDRLENVIEHIKPILGSWIFVKTL